MLPVGFGGDIEINAGLLPPEQVRCDRNLALLCQFVAMLADVGIHSKQLLQNNNGRSW